MSSAEYSCKLFKPAKSVDPDQTAPRGKAIHIFSAKNIRILYIESARTVNEMTLNEIVKLTTL